MDRFPNEGVCRTDFLTHADGFPLVEDLLNIVEMALLDLRKRGHNKAHCMMPSHSALSSAEVGRNAKDQSHRRIGIKVTV